MALPGVSTVINDRFYTISRVDIPQGPKVLILGRRTTADGTEDSAGNPIYDLDIYNVSSEKEAGVVFGPESDVVRGYVEAAAGGAQRISIVALPADTEFDHTNGTIDSVSYSGTDLWDDAWAAVEAAQPDIVVPWGRGSNSTDWDDYATPATPGNNDELGFHADNNSLPAKSWARLVAAEVERITNEDHPCFAVMGVKPYVGTSGTDGSMTPAQAQSHLTSFTNLVDHNDTDIPNPDSVASSNKMGTVGSYLSVVATEMKPIGYEDTYSWGWSNGAAMYAGYIAQLDSWSAPTMKRIFNVAAIRYNPTRSQQQTIIDKGLVPVALNFNREAVWVDARTFGNDRSQYVRLTTMRIVFDAVQVIRGVAQNFIGEASTLELRNALETGITNGLMGMQKLGALLSSDFSVTYFPRESKAVVDLILTPAFELRNIEVSVSLNL